jgi:hypothetical protein
MEMLRSCLRAANCAAFRLRSGKLFSGGNQVGMLSSGGKDGTLPLGWQTALPEVAKILICLWLLNIVFAFRKQLYVCKVLQSTVSLANSQHVMPDVMLSP